GLLHRYLFNLESGTIHNKSKIFVDHINGNKLDNRRENLRLCDNEKNQQNRFKTTGKSKYKGVIWDKSHNAWLVRIQPENEKRKYIGLYRDELEAAKAYNDAAIKIFGEFANINIIDDYTTGK